MREAGDLQSLPISSLESSVDRPPRIGRSRRAGLNGHGDLASVADCMCSCEAEHALVTSNVKTRLTHEVLGLSRAFVELSRWTQLVGKELPEGAEFCEDVAVLLLTLNFHFLYAIAKVVDRGGLLEGGRERIEQEGLAFPDSLREIDFDGRRFLCVPFLDERFRQRESAAEDGNC